MASLKTRAWLALAALAIVMALLLFVPAGTTHYWQARVYVVIFVGASALTTIYLERSDPALLERRMCGGPTAEKEPQQRVIMLFASLGFIALLVVPALNRRFGWSVVPPWVVVVGDILTAVGFYLNLRVFRVNAFTSATIEVAPDQHVVSTGPYAIVRHPMYASSSLYVIGTPLALGSYWGLLAVVAMLPFLIWRLLDGALWRRSRSRNRCSRCSGTRSSRWRHLLPASVDGPNPGHNSTSVECFSAVIPRLVYRTEAIG